MWLGEQRSELTLFTKVKFVWILVENRSILSGYTYDFCLEVMNRFFFCEAKLLLSFLCVEPS